MRIDVPVVQLFDEVVLSILVNKFRVDLSIIAQVIHQRLERCAISVEEYLILDLLQFMHIRKHLGKCALRH